MTQINLLPWRERARRIKKARFGMMLGGAAIFAVLITMGLHGRYSRLISEQQGRNHFISSSLGAEQGELNALNKEKEQQVMVVEQLRFISDLRQGDYKVVELLNGLARVAPDAVYFSKVMRVGNQITLFGRAKSNLQITQLMKNIKEVTIFERPDLSVITAKENPTGEERTFQILFVQKQ